MGTRENRLSVFIAVEYCSILHRRVCVLFSWEGPPKKDECLKRDCLVDVDEVLAALLKFPEVT